MAGHSSKASSALKRLVPDGPLARAAFGLQEGAQAARGRIADLRARPDAELTRGLPVPPARLRAKVVGKADAETFLSTGRDHASVLHYVLSQSGVELESVPRVLDFGCGCGRVIRWWPRVEGTALTGCDYNPALVRWCERNLPFASFAVNELLPPSPFGAGSFDLVYSLSILTHLTEEAQRAWIAEWRRILAPGGYLMFTVSGDSYTHKLSDEERARYDRGELILQFPRSQGGNLCAAIHPPRYVTEDLLGDGFELVGSRVGVQRYIAQDIYLARRLPG